MLNIYKHEEAIENIEDQETKFMSSYRFNDGVRFGNNINQLQRIWYENCDSGILKETGNY